LLSGGGANCRARQSTNAQSGDLDPSSVMAMQAGNTP
jgi:hypothetical protein